MIKILFIVLIALFPGLALAADPHWILDKTQSKVMFTVVSNDALISGAFDDFQADIVFSPDHPERGHITATVKTASVRSDSEGVADALPTEPWFNSAQYPEAVFKSTSIRHYKGKIYLVRGLFTLRGQTHEQEMNFELLEYNTDKKSMVLRSKILGGLMFKRNDYGVGQGDWVKTTVVADDVAVSLELVATAELTAP